MRPTGDGRRLIEVDGEVVGAVRLVVAGGVERIEDLAIEPSRRGAGIGSAVLVALDEEAARAGDDLVVRLPEGARARSLFERAGFAVAAIVDGEVELRRS